MKKIVFATNNANKLREIREILGNDFEVQSLKEIGCLVDLPETHDTLEENALEKAQYVYDHYGLPCFADDTGLEVDALHGAPGVYSARYASLGNPMAESHDSEANMQRLLQELAGTPLPERTAQFRTVVALVGLNAESGTESPELFEGIVRGIIATEKHGKDGFGYDPVFYPEGNTPVETSSPQTFAEMSAGEKNAISHRGRAVAKLVERLRKK